MTVAATAEHGRFLVDRRPRHDPVPPDQGPPGPGFAQVPDAAHARLRQLRSAGQPAGDRPVPPPRRHRVRRALPPRAVAARLWRRRAPTSTRSSRRRRRFNFRLVEVMMMLMLPLLAVALAVPPKRSSSVARHLPRDPDRRRLSQGQPICRAGRRARPASIRCSRLWVPLVAARGADLVDVPRPRPPARRPADRRARMVRRAGPPGASARLMPKLGEA